MQMPTKIISFLLCGLSGCRRKAFVVTWCVRYFFFFVFLRNHRTNEAKKKVENPEENFFSLHVNIIYTKERKKNMNINLVANFLYFHYSCEVLQYICIFFLSFFCILYHIYRFYFMLSFFAGKTTANGLPLGCCGTNANEGCRLIIMKRI